MLLPLIPLADILFSISKFVGALSVTLALYIHSFMDITVGETSGSTAIGFASEYLSLIDGTIGEFIGTYAYFLGV
jgi:hypothetical protein